MEGQPVGLAFFVLSFDRYFDKPFDKLSASASSATVLVGIGGALRQAQGPCRGRFDDYSLLLCGWSTGWVVFFCAFL